MKRDESRSDGKTTVEVRQFEYGMAYYQETGLIEAHFEAMPDMAGERAAVGPFLYAAGQRGWELCGLLPHKGGDGYDAWAIFKRPISE